MGRACAPCALVGSGSFGGVACEEAEEDEEKESVTEMLSFFFFWGLSVKYTTTLHCHYQKQIALSVRW